MDRLRRTMAASFHGKCFSTQAADAVPLSLAGLLGIPVACYLGDSLKNMHPGLGAGDFRGLLCAVLGGCANECDRDIAFGLCLEGQNAHGSPSTHSGRTRRS